MERKIELKLIDPNHYWMKGVYLIRIGRMKYVGKANCIGERMKKHQSEINKAIRDFSSIVNSVSGEKMGYSYIKVGRYLLENPQINSGTVELLERQVCSNRLYFSENFYLKEISEDDNSFNICTSGSRPGNEKDNLWDAKVIDGEVVCFDPRFPDLKVKTSVSGNKNRAMMKKINDEKQTPAYRKKVLLQNKEELIAKYPQLKDKIINETIKRLLEIG